VAVELQAERRPGRRPQIDQPQFVIQEVEIVMEALAGIRAHIGLVRLLVMPGLVGVAGFHRRDDMHQARMIATRLKHLAETISLRMWLLAICSMEIPACAANKAARSRTRSRSVAANCG